MPNEKQEIETLVRENEQMERRLKAASGNAASFGPMIELCADLTDIIEDITEISGKRGKIEHAAFATKVKFSRKIRRKAKDLGRFEEAIVREFDSGSLPLAHGKKMAEIVKLLKSNNSEKAAQEAQEFYELLEIDAKLKLNAESLLKKTAQLERERRDITAKLSDIEWLESQSAPNLEKIERQNEKAQLLGQLSEMRLKYLSSLASTPLPELIRKAKAEELELLGFPEISEKDAAQLSNFLQKAGLESKTAAQLAELSDSSQEKLRHVLPDFEGFRRFVASRREYLGQVASLPSSGFLAGKNQGPHLERLASDFPGAAQATSRLKELEKTAAEDETEWMRMQQIEQKKTSLAGIEKKGLLQKLQDLESLENILGRKEKAAGAPSTAKESKKDQGGILDALRGFFSGK